MEVLPVHDLSQVSQVPPNYVQPQDDIKLIKRSVPLIDLHGMKQLSEEEVASLAAQISEASKEWGFFQVVNHGIDLELLNKALDVSSAFFEMPKEDKMKFATNKLGLKEDGYGSQVYAATDAIQMWRDFLYITTLPLQKRTIEKWPDNPAEYRETMSELSQEFLDLAHRTLEFLSIGLGLPPTYLKASFGEVSQTFMTNLYPACPEPEKVLGFVPHSDFGGLTLLIQDDTPGLQLLKDESWILVDPVPGAINFFISDLLELVSNGRYKSSVHRVQVNKTKSRLSIASNYCCCFNTRLQPAPELIDDEHPQLCKPIVFGDYFGIVAETGSKQKSYMLFQ